MNQNAIMLTYEQSFAAMFCFLDKYWKQTCSDDIGGLLGSLSIQRDGKPADVAMWNEWLSCCKLALGEVDKGTSPE